MELTAPMVITSALTPGVMIDTDEGKVTLSVNPVANDDQGRTLWDVEIWQLGSAPMYKAERDISTWNPDPREAMATLLSFLAAEAESYQSTMGATEPDDGWMFNLVTAEWAYRYDGELSTLESELSGDNDE